MVYDPVQSSNLNQNKCCAFACGRIWRKQVKLISDLIFCSSLRQLSTSFISSSQGKRIVGATCAADFAQQYFLTTAINPANNHLFYFCKCYGHYDSGTQSVECIIHYWECPLTNWSLPITWCTRRVLSPNTPKKKNGDCVFYHNTMRTLHNILGPNFSLCKDIVYARVWLRCKDFFCKI